MYNLEHDFKTQMILACDDNGVFQEYIPRAVGHTGNGRRHLAITVLIYNSKGEVLLQKRKHKVFDNIWDLTGATHPVHTDNGDETLEECTLRCLLDEYGIKGVKLENKGAFNYFEKYNELCENEHCYLLVGEYTGEVYLNPEAGYMYKWMDKKEFLEDIEKNPDKYTPWAIESVKLLKEEGFFN
jgi:isopentenyl-diphosphate Delta-isomerase